MDAAGGFAPAQDQEGASIYTLRDIPATMRKEGWPTGAALMDRWLRTGPYAMDLRVKTGELPPPAPYVDVTLVTMRWAMQFSRAVAAEARLNATWAVPPRLPLSRQQVERQVRRWIAARRIDSSKPFRFGDLRLPVSVVNDTMAVNVEVVDSPFYGSVDDFYAALGRASFKIAVSGTVSPKGKAWQIEIEETGIFLRDTYDFIGEQSLGSWGPRGFSRLAVAAPEIEVDYRKDASWWQRGHDLFTVGNADFRRYRTMFGTGGDFLLFSNIRHRMLGTPVVMTLEGL